MGRPVVLRRARHQRRVLGQVQRDLAVARPDRAATGPDDRARGKQRVEVALVIARDPRREDPRFEIRRGDECALELRDRVEERGLAGARRVHAVPREREPRERDLFDRLDLFAQPRERALTQGAQHAAVDPLGAARARAELALEDRADLGKLAERARDERGTDAEAARELDHAERTVRPREAPRERDERAQLAAQERVREAWGNDDAERVAVLARVLGRDPARLARDRHGDRAAVALQLEQPFVHSEARRRSRDQLVAGQIAEPDEEIVCRIDVAGRAIGLEVLQLQLELRERVGVEQLAQLDLAEELAELRGIDGERLRASLRERRVALVDEVADVLEEQRRREGRRRPRIDRHDADVAAADRAEDLEQRRHVEDVLQAFAVRLEDDREGRVPRRDLQQLARAAPLMPERRPASRKAPRQQERARGGLAEPRGEERRLRKVLDDERLRAIGIRQHELRIGRALGLGEPRDDAVVGPEDVDLDVRSLADHRADRHRPGRVDLAAERRQHAHAPVPDLVEVALHEDRLVIRHRSGGGDLVAQVLEEIARGAVVEVVPLAQPRDGEVRIARAQLAGERADRPSELERARRGLPSRTASFPAPRAPATRGRGRA